MDRRLAWAGLLMSAFVAIAVAVWWLRPAREAGPTEEPAVVDYYAEGVTAVWMDKEGRPRERLTTPRVTHYADQPVMDAARPHLVIYRPADGPPWQLDAQSARLFEERNEVQLAGGVTLYQEGPQPLRLVTETMLVNTARKTAVTDDPLILTEPKGRVDAVGMRAFLDEKRVELNNQVRGSYAPAR